MKRLILIVAFALAFTAPAHAQQAGWPLPWLPPDSKAAVFMIDIIKTTGNEMIAETHDPSWAHLHTGHAPSVGLAVRIGSWYTLPGQKPLAEFTDLQLRYTVRGVPVSPWLTAPFTYTLAIDNPSLPSLDGLHDIAVEVQSVSRNDYSFRPIFLHLSRGRALAPDVPILSRDHIYQDYGIHEGSIGFYVDPTTARHVARPADPGVTPWHGPTVTEPGLYQEEMAPGTDLFHSTLMEWEEPASSPNAGMRFFRALPAKFDEDHRDLQKRWGHNKLPYSDGPRGIAWTSPYVTGQVATDGRFLFKEPGGRIAEMQPDGSVRTIAGYRVREGVKPVWILKPLEEVRRNMERVGTWLEGDRPERDGFCTPLDVAIDPQNARVYYVPGFCDQVIWKIDDTGWAEGRQAVVSVFAGDVGHTAGFVDGVGRAARFNGPASVTFDPVCDCLYVADQDNDAIRRISRAGAVTTIGGQPGQDRRQVSRGVTDAMLTELARDRKVDGNQYVIQEANRTAAAAHYARGANSATPIEFYLPHTVRVDSKGNLFVLDIGFGSIRKINTATLEATHFATLNQRFERNDERTSSRGWAWMDIDRWGNAGEIDGVYYTVFQDSHCDGETDQRVNEAYCWKPGSGGPGKFLFNDWSPNPDGWGDRDHTDPRHYGWGVAVDPRGALYMAGGGEHGITRLRKRKPGDPVVANYFDYMRAKELWLYGWQPGMVTPILRFGSEGHSLAGISPDPGDYVDAPDASIVAAFGLATASDEDRAKLITFIRLNGANWRPAGDGPPRPIDGTCSAWTWSVWEDVSLTTERRTGTRTESTPPQHGGRPCAPLTTTETRPKPLPPLVVSVSAVPKTCAYTLTAEPPDTSSGWSLQFLLDGVSFGTKVTKAPWTRTATKPAGATAFIGRWTKGAEVRETAAVVVIGGGC